MVTTNSPRTPGQTIQVLFAFLGFVLLVSGVVIGTAASGSLLRSRALLAAGIGSVLAITALTAALAASKSWRMRLPLAVATFLLTSWALILSVEVGTIMRQSTGSIFGYNTSVLEVLGISLTIVVLVSGVGRIDVASYWRIVLGLLELAMLVIGVVVLGWLGLLIVVAVNLVAIVVWSVRLAMRKESTLTYAALQAKVDTSEMEDLFDELKTQKAFKHLGSIGTANLISFLSQRRRAPDETRHIAPPIAMLHAVHTTDLETLTAKFDQLMRLYRRPANEAMDLADTLTVGARESAATFEETIDALIAVAHP